MWLWLTRSEGRGREGGLPTVTRGRVEEESALMWIRCATTEQVRGLGVEGGDAAADFEGGEEDLFGYY